jgi:hypothetical protein
LNCFKYFPVAERITDVYEVIGLVRAQSLYLCGPWFESRRTDVGNFQSIYSVVPGSSPGTRT